MTLTRAKLAAATLAVAAAGALAAIMSAPSIAAPDHATARAAGGPATIGLRRTSLGMILVNGRGFTVYSFSRDARNKDRCASINGCSSIWPAVRTNGAPRAGRGVRRSLLGTIRVAGREQVTYAGHPLYSYSGDASPGSTSYVGFTEFHGVWSALRSTGALVK